MTVSRPDIRNEQVLKAAFNTVSRLVPDSIRESGTVTVGNQNIDEVIMTYFLSEWFLTKIGARKVFLLQSAAKSWTPNTLS